jgi:hypothetical protein
MSRICGILGIIFAAAASTAAPAPATIRAPAMQSVLDCRSITDDGRRLACYDAAVGAMATAEKTGDLVTIDREQRRAVRRQAFGLQLPSLAIFDRGEKPEEADRITAKVAAAHRQGEGKWIIRLDDGAVWRQTDDNELLHDPHAGSTALISKGMLGSFFMKIDGQQAIRVHRDS